jgi:hypothetical protein
MSFLTQGRGSILPSGATWINKDDATWYREPDAVNIAAEIATTDWGTDSPIRHRVVKEADVLALDPLFRGARVDTGIAIEYDMVKARGVWRDRLRAQRIDAMKTLDAEWMKATATKKGVAAIEAQRQVWRDAPADPRIEAAKTIEQLKTITGP